MNRKKKDTFESLWKQSFQRIQFSTTIEGVGFNPKIKEQIVSLSQMLDTQSDTFHFDIINSLNSLNNRFLFIFDEFDNIENAEIRASFADLIKSFSDNNTNTTILLVGIADDIDELIGNHQSLERCLKQIKLPRMQDAESEEIIIKGMGLLGLTISDSVKKMIIGLCSDERGLILKKIGKGLNSRYRFTNPMMRAFVKLKIANIK